MRSALGRSSTRFVETVEKRQYQESIGRVPEKMLGSIRPKSDQSRKADHRFLSHSFMALRIVATHEEFAEFYRRVLTIY